MRLSHELYFRMIIINYIILYYIYKYECIVKALRISEGLIYYFSCTCLPLICSMVILNICAARPARAISSSTKVSFG